MLGGEPTAVVRDAGTIDLFGSGVLTGASYSAPSFHTSWTGTAGWSGSWELLGGLTTSAVTAVTRAPGTLDVFVRGTGGTVYSKAWNGTTWLPVLPSQWLALAGDMAEAPTAVSCLPGQMDLIARGADGSLWQRWFSGTNWTP